MSLDVNTHQLVPKHTLLSDAQKEKLFAEFSISFKELPKIMVTDAAIAKLGAKVGDVIKIERVSPTAGNSAYYRGVIER